ncbi:hypothetical protein [Polyangium sp. 6x1]|uniref:hypothetical protein n=1 Tax=Polyangium sp. 6x1 TaxID=3042689 RepID=UPI002482DAF3|nr:hypothetical protein [Polyangium sp. 6x1]MDI1442622.1 hypothetical protein [Polyangium sp. 6x1]
MTPRLRIPTVAIGILVSACDPSVTVSDAGQGGAGPSGSGGSNAGSTLSSSTSASSSGGASSSSTSASSSSSGGGSCETWCLAHVDCQAVCPSPYPDQNYCCKAPGCVLTTGACPSPCEPGLPCEPGTKCEMSSFIAPLACFRDCVCNASGVYDCQPREFALCPEARPTCGDPCESSSPLTCMCNPVAGGGPVPCLCESTLQTWQCSTGPGPCPDLGQVRNGSTCTEFPVGLKCDIGYCKCTAICGTQVWICPPIL